MMNSPANLSRRAFLLGVGGGVASASLAFGLWKYGPWVHQPESAPVLLHNKYVDYSGWILTPEDKTRLIAAGTITILPDTTLSGGSYAERKKESVDACRDWCLEDPSCQGFSWGSETHPDAQFRNQCSLKDSSQLTRTSNPNFMSGVR
jgi:hypothetical protein